MVLYGFECFHEIMLFNGISIKGFIGNKFTVTDWEL